MTTPEIDIPELDGSTLRDERGDPAAPSAESPERRRRTPRDWLVHGPDPIAADEPVSLLEVLLPWPLRVLAVLGIFAAAWSLHDTGLGQQLAWGLQAGALALFAIVASLWWQILLVDGVLAGLWLLPFPRSQGAAWSAFHVITFVNRQVGHFWALFVWFTIVLTAVAGLAWQLGGAAALVLLGAPLLNGIARLPLRFLGPDSDDKTSGDLLWRRRYLIYLVTAVGLVGLWLSALGQLDRLAPLLLAIGTGIACRTLRHYLRNRQVAGAQVAGGDARASLAARDRFRQAQSRAAQRADGPGMLLVPLSILGLVAFSWWLRRDLDQRLAAARAEPRHTGAPLTMPTSAEVALFLMADAQVHELGGAPFPGQTEIARVFVSSAQRPLALDLLDTVPLRRFSALYSALNVQRTTAGRSPMWWVHLGDLADLACQRELDAASQALGELAADAPLAGIALGNHEMSFDGSFHWSPYWDRACAGGKLEKDDAAERVARSFSASLRGGTGQLVRLPASLWYPHGGSLSAVRELGAAHHRGQSRTLLGIFLDTSDGRAFDWGMPGSIGAISAAQLDALEAALVPLQTAAAKAEAPPVYVLFGHIPYGDLASSSRARLARWITQLDARQNDLAAEPRVLAYLSAHRHALGTERHCIDNRYLREVTIGSTTDPPQQAAVVEIGPDLTGRLVLSVRSVQSVARPSSAVDPPLGIDAAACRQVAHQLSQQRSCQTLLPIGPDAAPPRDCQAVEHSTSFAQRWAALATYAGPRDPDTRQRFASLDAERLLTCICREGACETPRAPLRGDTHWQSLEQAWSHPGRRIELSCLAWAASVSHAHAAASMTLAEALRCSFDDPTLAAEQTYSTALEGTTCN